MDYRKAGFALGIFSIGLGLIEIAAPAGITRVLGLKGKRARNVVALFGARELLAGATLVRAPAVSTNVWNRVAGDCLDMAALAFAFGRSTRRPALAGALAFVGGATVLDALTARALDRETGRTIPRTQRSMS